MSWGWYGVRGWEEKINSNLKEFKLQSGPFEICSWFRNNQRNKWLLALYSICTKGRLAFKPLMLISLYNHLYMFV